MQRLESASHPIKGAESDASSDRALWRLCELFREDLEGLRIMIEEYLHESLKLVGQMQSAVRKGELAHFRAAAHTLKSNAQVFGEVALSRACAAVELMALPASKETIETLLSRLVIEQERCRILLQAKYRVLMSALTRR